MQVKIKKLYFDTDKTKVVQRCAIYWHAVILAFLSGSRKWLCVVEDLVFAHDTAKNHWTRSIPTVEEWVLLLHHPMPHDQWSCVHGCRMQCTWPFKKELYIVQMYCVNRYIHTCLTTARCCLWLRLHSWLSNEGVKSVCIRKGFKGNIKQIFVRCFLALQHTLYVI